MNLPFPTPLVLGHRGSPRRAPENTLRSLALALEEGADGVELDVQRAADGTPVVIHDATLDRTGQGRGPVAALSWPELSRAAGEAEPVPSLEEAAAWAAGAGAWLNVEIKAEGVEEAALAVLRRAGMLERAVLSSFSVATMRALRARAPEATRFLLTESWHDGVLENAAECAVQGICLRVDAADALTLEVLRREGYAVIVWTVDDPERMRDLLRAGVAGIISNFPAAAARAREEVVGRGTSGAGAGAQPANETPRPEGRRPTTDD